jgi:hypothetical protein
MTGAADFTEFLENMEEYQAENWALVLRSRIQVTVTLG